MGVCGGTWGVYQTLGGGGASWYVNNSLIPLPQLFFLQIVYSTDRRNTVTTLRLWDSWKVT